MENSPQTGKGSVRGRRVLLPRTLEAGWDTLVGFSPGHWVICGGQCFPGMTVLFQIDGSDLSEIFLKANLPSNGRILPHSLFFFNWSIVHLQRCVSFRSTAKWFSYTYIYIYCFQILFPYRLLQIIEYSSLCYNSRSLLVIYFLYSSDSCMFCPPQSCFTGSWGTS